jgi:outer membrane protein TolC
MKRFLLLPAVVCLLFISIKSNSQTANDSILTNASLSSCIQYALKHQALIQQALTDEKITEENIKTKLADWFPQLNFNANYQNNMQLPATIFSGNIVYTGVYNNSTLGFNATQNIFNKDVLLASKSKDDIRKQIRQITDSDRISLAVYVTKAFYDVLLTQKQADVLDEDILRLERSLKDAYNQYQGGLVDKIDYKRATISLNNTKAQRKQSDGVLTAKYFYLKQLMGYPDSSQIHLLYDSARMEKELIIDTTQQINYDDRIEFKILQTQKKLMQYNIQYYKWGYYPTLSAYANYNLNYLNSEFSKLYTQNFPNANIGLQLSVPIFQGMKRTHQVRTAQLQSDRLNFGEVLLKSRINTEYAQSLANYKGSLAHYFALKENVELASDVYNVIQLQYQHGIKTYLDVILAESDLKTSQLNYFTSLYQLLASKIDVQKALGLIQY